MSQGYLLPTSQGAIVHGVSADAKFFQGPAPRSARCAACGTFRIFRGIFTSRLALKIWQSFRRARGMKDGVNVSLHKAMVNRLQATSHKAAYRPMIDSPRAKLSHQGATALMLACVLLLLGLLSGCATPGGGESLHAPTQISELYSQVSLRVKLALTPGERRDPFDNPERECAGPTEFEERVARIGARLSVAAYRAYPTLAEQIGRAHV